MKHARDHAKTPVWGLMLAFALAMTLVMPMSKISTAQANASTTPSTFVALPYSRFMDTKAVGQQSFGPGETRDYTVLGSAGIPTTGVSAVVVDIAATSTTDAAGTAIQIWTTGSPRPGTAIVRASTATVPMSNTAVVEPDAQGRISVFNSSGTTDLNIDVQGYFTSGSNGGFHAARESIVNTMYSKGVPGPVVNGTTADVQVTGGEVPADATAVFANVAALNPDSDGTFSFYPRGGAVPYAKSVNYSKGGDDTTGLFIPLDSDGGLTVTNSMGAGAVDLQIDIQGYFTASSSSEGQYTALAQTKLFDSASSTPVAPGASVDVAVGGTNGMPTYGVEGAVVTLTATAFSQSGSLKVYPTGGAAPYHGSVAFDGSESGNGGVAATTIVTLGLDGKVTVTNTSSAPVDVRVVLQGWFSGYRAVSAANESAFIARAVGLGEDARLANLAVWDAELASTMPQYAVVTDDDPSADPVSSSDWIDVSTDALISDGEFAATTEGDSVVSAAPNPADEVAADSLSATNGTCASGYKIGKWSHTARYYGDLDNLLWKTHFAKRWCYNYSGHTVGSKVYWKVNPPEFTIDGNLAYNYKPDENVIKNRYKEYNGYAKGSHWSFEKQALEHCYIKIGLCTPVYNRYWITGNYDGSKTAGGNW